MMHDRVAAARMMVSAAAWFLVGVLAALVSLMLMVDGGHLRLQIGRYEAVRGTVPIDY